MSYTATPYTAYLTLTGTLAGQPSARLLVGQDLRAKVTLGFTYSTVSYAWSVAGGKPYKDFVEAQDQSTGEFEKWTPSDYNSKDTTDVCFDQQAASAAVSVTVTTTNPNLTFTLSKSAIVDVPKMWDPPADGNTYGSVTLTIPGDPITPNPLNPTAMQLYGATSWDPSLPTWGIYRVTWIETPIVTPAPYRPEGTGQFCFIQLNTDNVSRSKDGTHFTDDDGFGIRGLDAQDPYKTDPLSPVDAKAHIPSQDVPPLTGPDNWLTFAGAPNARFNDLVSVNWDFYSDTYYVYYPPPNGNGTQKAPMMMWTWSCGGKASLGSGVWVLTEPYAHQPVDCSDVPLFPPASGEDTTSDHHLGWRHRFPPVP